MDKNYKSQITIPNDPNSKLKEKIYCFHNKSEGVMYALREKEET